jgi:hypothetical protein
MAVFFAAISAAWRLSGRVETAPRDGVGAILASGLSGPHHESRFALEFPASREFAGNFRRFRLFFTGDEQENTTATGN